LYIRHISVGGIIFFIGLAIGVGESIGKYVVISGATLVVLFGLVLLYKMVKKGSLVL
tara:strand:- start:10429 stop:10599 length:171 start_codon:yes stop_codon:yes gene_type:complete